MKRVLLAAVLASTALFRWAKGDDMSLETFLGLAFVNGEPEQEALWFSDEQRQAIRP